LGLEARERLARCARLSPQGIELALSEHLECQPEAALLDRFLSRATKAATCHVILSANVCIAAHRAIAFAVACAPRVYVRASRRDPVVAELLIRQLRADPAFLAHGHIQAVEKINPADGHALHVYGSDETIADIAANLSPGVALAAHGTGLGVAVLASHSKHRDQAALLARDLVVFDGQGCLSPRLAMLCGSSAAQLDAFAGCLHAALGRLGEEVPRGPLDDSDQAALRNEQSIFEALGGWLDGRHHAIGVHHDSKPLRLLPALRSISLARCEPDELAARLAAWTRYTTCVAGDLDHPFVQPWLQQVPHARRCKLGQMQKPPFDGPIDLRLFD
jgi:hypothetical protein